VKPMEFGQFLTEMTLMPTPESVGPAGKVVDLEKLHRYRYFPDWTTLEFCLLEELQGAQQAQKPLFSAAERGSGFFRYLCLRKFDFSVFEFSRLNLTGMDDFRRLFRGGRFRLLSAPLLFASDREFFAQHSNFDERFYQSCNFVQFSVKVITLTNRLTLIRHIYIYIYIYNFPIKSMSIRTVERCEQLI